MFPRDPLDQLCWSRNRNVDICGCEVQVTSANQVSYGVEREREEVVVLCELCRWLRFATDRARTRVTVLVGPRGSGRCRVTSGIRARSGD